MNRFYSAFAHALVLTSLMFLLVIQVTGCTSNSYTAQGAGKGGATGAVSGAVGGLVSALVFGGDPVERAARGAVYGGAVGATAGAIAGSEADKRAAEQRRAETEAGLEKLRKDIGEDAYNGLEALADCRHEISLKQAGKAQQSDNPNYALAGLWLEVLSYADKGDKTQIRSLLPKIVEKDWNVKSESQAETSMRQALSELKVIRKEYNLPQTCGRGA